MSSQCCSQAPWIPGYHHQFLVLFLRKCREEDQEKVKMELKAGGHPVWAACLILQDTGLHLHCPKLRHFLGNGDKFVKKSIRLTDRASGYPASGKFSMIETPHMGHKQVHNCQTPGLFTQLSPNPEKLMVHRGFERTQTICSAAFLPLLLFCVATLQ